MFLTTKKILFSFLAIFVLSAAFKKDQKPQSDFRDFYGITWNGKAHDNLLFAKQMGYGYVMYQKGMENDPLAKDLRFYIETPQYSVYPLPRQIDTGKEYSEKEAELYTRFFARKDSTKFPGNLATGWFFSKTTFSVEPDFQQQWVIDTLVDRIARYAKSVERKDKNFLFGGCTWDVPQLAGDFWGGGKQITLAYWTGSDRSYKPADIKYDYETYSDGHAEFYKQLFNRLRKDFPGARFIVEPYKPWESWFEQIAARSDAADFNPDMIIQERFGTEFLTDTRIYKTGLLKKENTGSTTPDKYGEKENRQYAGEAAVNGAWFGWYGRFGGTGDMPAFKNIYEVPARLQLVRRVPGWDNLNSVPVKERKWTGEIYSSPMSGISNKVIWSTHPDKKRIFAVWLEKDGVVPVKLNRIRSIAATDSLFIEKGDGRNDVVMSVNGLVPESDKSLNRGYIITLK